MLSGKVESSGSGFPFILMRAETMGAEFIPAFSFLMSHEDARRSGVVTRDSDGRTRLGICEKFHPYLPAEFWTCPVAEAIATAAGIYQIHYWSPLSCAEIIDQAVASKLFDMAVVMGCTEAVTLAQRAANGLLLGSTKAPAIDGKMGPKTIASLNGCPPSNLVETLCNLSKIFFYEDAEKHPEKKSDLSGWLRRAEAVPPQLASVAVAQKIGDDGE